LEPIDFGRRLAVERELIADAEAPPPNVLFDESGNFVLYPSLLGIKVGSSFSHQNHYDHFNLLRHSYVQGKSMAMLCHVPALLSASSAPPTSS
jgi:hypothetical protein